MITFARKVHEHAQSSEKKEFDRNLPCNAEGINGQPIFLDDEDNEKYLQTLKECKAVSEFELYGYCLMGDHAHLLKRIFEAGGGKR